MPKLEKTINQTRYIGQAEQNGDGSWDCSIYRKDGLERTSNWLYARAVLAHMPAFDRNEATEAGAVLWLQSCFTSIQIAAAVEAGMKDCVMR